MPFKPQPFCNLCFMEKFRRSKKVVSRYVKNGPVEICCMCGNRTRSGFYLRVNPININYGKAS